MLRDSNRLTQAGRDSVSSQSDKSNQSSQTSTFARAKAVPQHDESWWEDAIAACCANIANTHRESVPKGGYDREEPTPGPLNLIHVEKDGECHSVLSSNLLEDIEVSSKRMVSSRDVIPALKKVDFRRAIKLAGCGSFKMVSEWFHHGNKLTTDFSLWCNMPRLCHNCAHARSVKLAVSYSAKVAQVLTENPNLRAWLVTLTIKNRVDLKGALDHLMSSLKALVQRLNNFKKGKGPYTILADVEGFARSIEIKRGAAGGWHPHAHMIVLVDKDLWLPVVMGGGLELEPIKREQLSREWRHVTGDSYIVHAAYLRSSRALDLGLAVNDGLLVEECMEVFKYMVKPGSCTPEDRVLAWQVSERRHLVAPYGVLRGVKVPEELDDEPLDGLRVQKWLAWRKSTYSVVGGRSGRVLRAEWMEWREAMDGKFLGVQLHLSGVSGVDDLGEVVALFCGAFQARARESGTPLGESIGRLVIESFDWMDKEAGKARVVMVHPQWREIATQDEKEKLEIVRYLNSKECRMELDA